MLHLLADWYASMKIEFYTKEHKADCWTVVQNVAHYICDFSDKDWDFMKAEFFDRKYINRTICLLHLSV